MANSVRIHKMTQREELECKVTPRRWLVLAVFSLYLMSNQFQWISYSTITDKVAAFYVVPTTTVDWLSMIFMIVYIPLIFPATWLLDKKGLRLTAILGSGINFLGAAIKCFSPYSNRFAVTFYWTDHCCDCAGFYAGNSVSSGVGLVCRTGSAPCYWCRGLWGPGIAVENLTLI